MICPLILAALIQRGYFEPENMPENFLRSTAPICVSNQCAFYNRILSACGQSLPEAASVATALLNISTTLDGVAEDISSIAEGKNFS